MPSLSQIIKMGFVLTSLATMFSGFVSPSSEKFYFVNKDGNLINYRLKARGVTDMGLIAGPNVGWGAMYVLEDSRENRIHSLILFDEKCDGNLDIATSSFTINGQNNEAVCYWKEDPRLKNYGGIFNVLQSRHGKMLKETYDWAMSVMKNGK